MHRYFRRLRCSWELHRVGSNRISSHHFVFFASSSFFLLTRSARLEKARFLFPVQLSNSLCIEPWILVVAVSLEVSACNVALSLLLLFQFRLRPTPKWMLLSGNCSELRKLTTRFAQAHTSLFSPPDSRPPLRPFLLVRRSNPPNPGLSATFEPLYIIHPSAALFNHLFSILRDDTAQGG